MILNNIIRYIFVAVTSFFLLVRAASSSSLLRGRSDSDTTENSHQHHRRTIIGGSNASSGRYSYFASLRAVFNGATGSHFCGGAVIAPKVILTAAHCVGGKYAKQVRAVVGRSGFDDINDGEEIDVIQEIIHPNFARVEGKAPNYDFALLILKKAVNTDDIKILKLNAEPNIPVGTPLTVVGHGYTKEGTYSVSNKLKELQKYAISNEVCKQSKGSGWQNFEDMITDSMICAEDSPDDNVEEDKCSGDSGGPLLIKGDDPTGADDVEVGVVSWGYKCAIEGYPGVYARVSEAYDWVQEQLDELFPTPTSQPSFQPSLEPSFQPSSQPSTMPSSHPTSASVASTPVSTTLVAPTKQPSTPALVPPVGTLFPTVSRGRSGERKRSEDGDNHDPASLPSKTSQGSSSSSITFVIVVGVLLLFLLTLLIRYSKRNR